jgi:hypothetical protein
VPPHIRSQATVDQGLFLSDLGILDREIAEMCRVAVKTVRRWRRLYQRGGVVRTANGSACPGCHDRALDPASYALLLGAYLGDGHIVRNKRGIYLLSVAQDARYTALIDEWRSAVLAVKGGGSCHINNKPGCVAILSYWMHWPCLFPQHGAGRKHERPIVLEPWQQEIIEADPRPFLRGLFHSDGCRITNWTVRWLAAGPKRYEYPRYFFSNESADIIGLCTWALDLLGIAWRRPKYNTVSVARREAVAALDEFVGPKY